MNGMGKPNFAMRKTNADDGFATSERRAINKIICVREYTEFRSAKNLKTH